MTMTSKLLFFFIFFYLFFWFFLTFKITEVPPGINGDEAAIGYNAALVAKTGRDQSGRFLPLFVSAFNLTDWKQPITFYSTVLVFKIFGISYSALCEVSVVIILISATLIFFLCKEILGEIGGFISVLLFMTIPSVLIQSHLALENIAPVPFTILWLWMLSKYQKSLGSKYLFLSAIFLGTGLFTYPGMRLIFPIFCLLTIGFIYYLNRKKKLKKIFIENLKFLIIVGVFPIFMYAVKNQYPGAILAYNRPHIQTAYQELIMPYISSFDPSFLFLTGDTTVYHSTGRQGVFLIATLPLFILGIIRIIRKKEIISNFILITFFVSPILYGFTEVVHRGSRLLILLPLFTIITTAGAFSIINLKNKMSKRFLIIIMAFLIMLNYLDFIRDYWYEYPGRVKSDFAKPIHLVFEKFSKESKEKNLKPLIQNDLFGQNPVAFNFFEQAYFPNEIARWDSSQPISKNSILLTDNPVIKINNPALKSIGIDNSNFYLLENK